MFAALPHKSGNDQLAAIAEFPGRTLLLPLLRGLKPADAQTVEEHLERVNQGTDINAQARVIAFVFHTGSPLTPRAQKLMEPFLRSQDRLVRSLALGVTASRRYTDLLAKMAASDWDAETLEREKDHFEIWWGSEALMAAAELGIAAPSDVVARVAPRFLARATAFPNMAGQDALVRIGTAFAKAAVLDCMSTIPLVVQRLPTNDLADPPLRSIIDEPVALDATALFNRMNETREVIAARQKRARDAVHRFEKEVTFAEAGIILDDFGWSDFDTIVAADRALALSWLKQMTCMGGRRLRLLHFFGLGLARATAQDDPEGAAALYRRLATEVPFTRRVVGVARIPADAVAVWSNADLAEIKAICFERLDRVASDAEISNEVTAALMHSKAAEVSEYMDLRIATGLPAAIARAIMVAGFCDSSTHASRVLQTYASHKGFVGRAAAAARYAYERNDWSRHHWHDKMRAVATPEDFWRYAVLFTKIVDARYDLWCGDRLSGSAVFAAFLPTVESRIESRIKNWQDKRKTELFGQDVPDPVFLT